MPRQKTNLSDDMDDVNGMDNIDTGGQVDANFDAELCKNAQQSSRTINIGNWSLPVPTSRFSGLNPTTVAAIFKKERKKKPL